MLENLPVYIPLIFGLTTVVTLLLFIRVIKNSSSSVIQQNVTRILTGLMIWLIIQATLTVKNIYKSDTDSFPPKILLFGICPAMLAIILLFITAKGRYFIDSLPIINLTCLHIVRIPVELVLFWLFLNKAVPELMTFEGRSFDIAAGITAPFIAYFGFTKGKISKRFILIWNFFCTGLLINIIVHAFLSVPSPVQKIAFDQPNIAILNLPFSWLPTFLVPVVLFAHLASIRQLLKN